MYKNNENVYTFLKLTFCCKKNWGILLVPTVTCYYFNNYIKLTDNQTMVLNVTLVTSDITTVLSFVFCKMKTIPRYKRNTILPTRRIFTLGTQYKQDTGRDLTITLFIALF